MQGEHLLYTVTGSREPFYAAVDPQTGRVWTSPTRDGAMRQARDAGIDGFVERSISRSQFLHSLGIDDDPTLHIPRPDVSHHEPATDSAPRPRAGSWFVAGGDHSNIDATPADFKLPPRLKGVKKSARRKNGGSPFAAAPIATRVDPSAADDLLIIPSKPAASAAPTPFTDAPADHDAP